MAKSVNNHSPSLLAFKTVLVLFVFLAGGAFAYKQWQSFKFLREGYRATATLFKEQTQVRPALLGRQRYAADGVTVYHPDKANNGVTALQGTFPGGTQIRLIDMSGNEIHRWPINFFKIWPNPTHLDEKDRPKSEFGYHTQGMALFSDGSVVINIGDKGTAKLGKCGEVEWTIDRLNHHSITPLEGGGFWIPSSQQTRDIPEHLLFPGVSRALLESDSKANFGRYENLVLQVDESGKVRREFSVLQSLYDGGFESRLFDVMDILPTDPTHVNDIEIVTQVLADKIAGVKKGDLLVSIRQMHMLAILDSATGEIKWHFIGPWIRQHDPDITEDGNIVVFNNGREGFNFNRIEGSNIIELDPETGKTQIIYPLEGQPSFYTDVMGTHQLLENGNRLIAESRAGHVFEVTSQGEIVWDYVKPYDETYASLIEVAQRLDSDYFTVKDWSCD